MFTTLIYVVVMMVSIAYYSEGKLLKTIWATLTLFSFISFPFIERFEFIAVCFWMLIIIPNLCLYLWAAYRGVIRLVKIRATTFVWIFSIIVFIFTMIIQTRTEINTINTVFGNIAFYVIFIYPILLWILAILKRSFHQRRCPKMNKLRCSFIVFLSLIFLYGCAQTNVLDKVGLTTLVGYDVGTESKIAATAVIREVNPEFQSKVEVLTTENETSKGNRMEANRKLSKK